MFDYIERLRQRPESAKKRFAFFVAFTIAGLIFVVWLSILFPSWKRDHDRENGAVVEEPTPRSALGATFTEGWNSLRESFGDVKGFFNGANSTSTTEVSTTEVH